MGENPAPQLNDASPAASLAAIAPSHSQIAAAENTLTATGSMRESRSVPATAEPVPRPGHIGTSQPSAHSAHQATEDANHPVQAHPGLSPAQSPSPALGTQASIPGIGSAKPGGGASQPATQQWTPMIRFPLWIQRAALLLRCGYTLARARRKPAFKIRRLAGLGCARKPIRAEFMLSWCPVRRTRHRP